ncbi:hypothetical protein [Rhodoblastus sp.]|jgi:hypothetical protein|uniref:hypothetical protein n=1 Tax=Rhodoblastus sp. TaxID=1962975 RepID=UPI0025FA23C7|nr:hypothetical protein [Rhodoblastus sp.]
MRDVFVSLKIAGRRSAARVGLDALERGEFKNFANVCALVEHLNRLADTVLADPEVHSSKAEQGKLNGHPRAIGATIYSSQDSKSGDF